MKRNHYGLLAVACLCSTVSLAQEIKPKQDEVVGEDNKEEVLQEEQSFGDYVVRIYEWSFEILRKGVRVYATDSWNAKIGSQNEEDKTNSLVSIGADITGDGKPNLVVSEWSGGNHGYFWFHVFEIGDRFRYIQTIYAVACGYFKNLDNDPALEFPMFDCHFVDWRTCSADSPAPDVILKYNGKQYVVDHNLMRKPALSDEELIKIATDIRENLDWEKEPPPVKLWARMLDLIYSGNMDQAWSLIELSWPAAVDGKEDFLKDFRAKLAESHFWKDVQKLNRRTKSAPRD